MSPHICHHHQYVIQFPSCGDSGNWDYVRKDMAALAPPGSQLANRGFFETPEVGIIGIREIKNSSNNNVTPSEYWTLWTSNSKSNTPFWD